MFAVAARTAGAITLAIWVWLALFRGRFWRLRERLDIPRTLPAPARVVAVIPARDEEETIGRTVTSLLRQQFPGSLRVVVADDESSDRTADIARAAGASLVLRVAPRPPGWKGKLWAVASGLEGGCIQTRLLSAHRRRYRIHLTRDRRGTPSLRQRRASTSLSVMVRLRTQSWAVKNS